MRTDATNRHVHPAAGILTLVAVLVLALCASSAAAASFVAHGSARQVYATGVGAGAKVSLLDAQGHKIASRNADPQGGVLFRNVKPGKGYRVLKGGVKSPKLTVFSNRAAPLSKATYSQTTPTSGYGYITMRDGTKLATNTYLPAGPGPYPTLIEYSGYGYANPDGAQSSIEQIATLMGFAVVDVNMRGTGCSGGAYDFFDRLQSLDGYDLVETISHQPWVLHGKVGMMGISFGGISQLFVGATNPPHLAAIAPLSVIDQAATTLYPGGMINSGFALSWAKDRVHDAKPASPTGGQPWAYDRIQNGDTVCEDNQALHAEAVDLIAKIHRNNHYVPKVADPVSPITFVNKIKVPTFMACQWTDEQTGGHCATLASHFTGTKRKWFTFTNGTHIDSLDPYTFNRWYDFLKLYVQKVNPTVSPVLTGGAPVLYQVAMGVPGVTLPPDPIQTMPSYQAALTAYQALPPIRILFDSGAGGTPGQPYPGFERSFSRFPLPNTKARSFYLANNGALANHRQSANGHNSFTWDKSARNRTDFTGDTGTGNLWTASPTYNWQPNPPGSALSYVSPPLASNTTVVGAGGLQAWIKASAPSVDLQVTISEVRPDNKETFVQSGWLRANERKLTANSTLLDPQPTFRLADVAPLPKNKFSKLTVPLYYQGHVYRAGSRIRVTITAPSGDQPIWAFDNTHPKGTARVTLSHSSKHPSRLVLPVIPGISVPTGLPPCPGLRGEPCRTYVPFVNHGT